GLAGQRVLPGREGQHVVRDRPALLLAHRVGERGHGRTVEAKGHGAEDIAHARSALELAAREVGRASRKLEVVGPVGRRHPVALAAIAVALEALGLPIEILPAPYEL